MNSTNIGSSDQEATIVHSVGENTSAGSRFRILRPHARGGLGEVFVARDEELSREVALKQIQHQYADQADSRSRFLLEAEITGGLEHPGIVPVYGLGAYANGRPFYAMRFIRGDSLKDSIEQFHKADRNARRSPGERALAFRKLLSRLIDVCNAIEYAHARGVLHRDLKPGNVMLGKYGETLVVDWGMAKAIGRPDSPSKTTPAIDEVSLHPILGSDSTPTQDGAAVGTPQFMSPEQAAGRHDELGPASDVYSLGATLYCLLTGQAPLADKRGHGVGELLRLAQCGDITPPRQLRPDVPKPLDAICRKAMALAPANRYPSARALADDLEHWLADEPITAQPDRAHDRLFRFARRHRSVAVATMAAAILIAIVSSAATVLVNQQRQEADRQRLAYGVLLIKERQALETAKRASEKAERSADEANRERAKAEHSEQLATEAQEQAEQLANEAQLALTKAEDSAQEAKRARDKAVESERKERAEHEKADKLADFLIGAIQPEDPTRFTGATFFAPKANSKTYTVVEMLKIEKDRALNELGGIPLAQAAVLDSIGDVCRQLALLPDAKRYLTKALQIRRDQLSHDDPDLATSCFHTAWYYHEVGNFEKAVPLYLESLEIRRKTPGAQSLVADTLQNLAWLHCYERSVKDMENCFEEALRIRERLFQEAPQDPGKSLLRDVVFTKLGMASAYTMISAHEGAKRFLDAKRIVNDKDFKAQLVKLKDGKTELVQALEHFVKAGDDRFFGKPADVIHELEAALHFLRGADDTIPTLAGTVKLELARTYARTNQLQKAEEQYRAGIEIARRQKMFQIPQQAERISEYGLVLRKLGRAQEVHSVWDEYLREQKFRFGEKHDFYLEAEAARQKFLAAK